MTIRQNDEIEGDKISVDKNTIKHVNIWNIHSDDQYDQKIRQYIDIEFIEKNTMLLDLTKPTYSLIEKYIYDSAMFHFARLNIYDRRR